MIKITKNIQDSVRARLHNIRKETGVPYMEILRNYAMERFLYRLGQTSYGDKFVLKGALLFAVWDFPERRTTLDIDLLAYYSNQITEIVKVVEEVCRINVIPDGLYFDSASVSGVKIKEDADYEGVRVRFMGFLGKARVSMQIDFGFGDIIYPAPKKTDFPVILDFPAPRLKVYAIETVVSEKFEAMVQLGALNSRMKDFYDIWVILHQFDFDGSKLIEALKGTFTHRKTAFPEGNKLFVQEIYDEKSDRQLLWKAFLKKGGIEHLPHRLSEIALEIEKFLITPIDAVRNNYEFTKNWKISNGWE